jgi:hypothetical protein
MPTGIYKRTKKHILALKKGYKNSPIAGMKGKKHSTITKNKMSLKAKLRLKNPKNHPMYGRTGKLAPMYGKKHNITICKFLSKQTKKMWKNKKFIDSHKIHKHHIDLNHQNKNKSNLLKLKAAIHRKLHSRAYDYLVKISKIRQYIKWFDKQYGLRIKKHA